MGRSADEMLHAPSDDMRKRGINGIAAIGLTQGLKIAVQFLSVIVLSRLLTPSDFGLVAMVTPIAAFVTLFQDLGLTQALITSSRVTHGQASTMFWVNVAIASALALILVAVSPLISDFYGQPRLIGLVVALAAVVVVSGFTAQQTAMLNRNLQFSALAVLDGSAALLTFLGATAFALIWPTPWALIFGTALSQVATMVGSWIYSGWRPGRPQRLSTINDMLKMGGNLTGFNLLNFLVRNFDNILIGRFNGPTSLGYYDRAYKLLLFPLTALTRPVGRVMLPVLSRLMDEPARYRHAYLRTIELLTLAIMPAVVALMATADEVFSLLIGAKWLAAAPIFRWLAVSGLHQAFSTTFSWLFVSQQRTGEFSRWGVINGTVVVAAMVIGLPDGPLGVARAYALADTLLLLPILIWLTGRRGPVASLRIVRTIAPFALAAGLSLGLLILLPHLVPISGFALLLSSAAVAYITFLCLLGVAPGTRHVLFEVFAVMRQIAKRNSKPKVPSL